MIYHLERLGRNSYLCAPKKKKAYEVEIEDGVMKPLVSGPEAKRYEVPETETFLPFPYERDPGGQMTLLPAATMEERFPKAWAYLRGWEKELRKRERSAFDDDQWYRFGRIQNIDKQDVEKLIVAQTVPRMRVCADYGGTKYLNNVRVNGILSQRGVDQSYLLGALNGPR